MKRLAIFYGEIKVFGMNSSRSRDYGHLDQKHRMAQGPWYCTWSPKIGPPQGMENAPQGKATVSKPARRLLSIGTVCVVLHPPRPSMRMWPKAARLFPKGRSPTRRKHIQTKIHKYDIFLQPHLGYSRDS